MKTMFSIKIIAWAFTSLFFLLYGLGVYWSIEPESINLHAEVTKAAKAENVAPVIGYTTTTALIKVSETLLYKPGGYLSNDILPPSVFLDNMPAWEFGVLEMVRDMALVMRKDFSRSQSQSLVNKHLKEAQPRFNIDSRNWAMPSAESEYGKAIEHLYAYRSALVSTNGKDKAQFYARADNLRAYLDEVQKRLGSYSQRLSQSVAREQVNTDLAGDNRAEQSSQGDAYVQLQTSWWLIDDVFYEARGATWALLQLLRAIEIDFNSILENKNAKISLQQIIRELEASQESLWSPMILNGSGFGLLANHSLVMANYISRANAALIDLNELLTKG
ncbi:hypothetical protein CMT41_16885 [Colwellia sp. MT41]|uniref:DUF2333 domain-containing protein n=1 Tax=Colwellia marinimaniae TaxID=1513592 RepID=A0ABQ0MYM6_9GAMM|nr:MULTISPECIES: DUF2333 family protein [Colwellia]ALO36220.1 hypothetical protein CMT41_16885 [Colwellia sp. MT41]GAW97471.1 hypothetical protein MTCD1_03098 [Colwellia marinimaniae]